MIKFFSHKGKEFKSIEVDGVPYAYMEEIINFIVDDTWDLYTQVLNSSEDTIVDLALLQVDCNWLIPIANIKPWLFSIHMHPDSSNGKYERFRKYRVGIDSLYKILWGMEAGDNVIFTVPCFSEIEVQESETTLWDIHNIFASYDIPDTILEGCDLEGKIFGPLHYIQLIVSSTECGPRGSLLADQLDYIENMPLGDEIWSTLDEILILQGIPPMAEYLDEYLDRLNAHISYQLMTFIGDIYNAQ